MSILSIQSSVTYGHVGNAAAVPTLQRLGFEVWPVDTVRFSNHPGYGNWRGRVIEAGEVEDLIAGLGERGVFPACRAVLSGYLGSVATGRVVREAVARVKAANPDAIYCCDPVIGDRDEGLYVPQSLAAFFASHLVPAADVVVPNAFELAYLTGHAVDSVEAARAAAEALIAKGPRIVVATSLPPTEGQGVATLAASAEGAWVVETPRLETTAKGAGDVFAALFLGRYLETGAPADSLAGAVSSVFALIEATVAARSEELELVAAQDRLTAPRRRFVPREVR